ncbi:hypothetical protein C8R43DRAFT_964687 [Mycena crocata]|nr:hypothetical protein C8R43DRAFT_964687 [Mycena crocata]
MKTEIPRTISDLPEPPKGFRPCAIPLKLADNWIDHNEFSRKGNKQYCVLFHAARPGVYSRKPDCVAWVPRGLPVSEVVGCFQKWIEVLAVWAKYCYHRHSKCLTHQNACAESACPGHPLDPDAVQVKPEPGDILKVKREPGDVIKVKREAGGDIKVRRAPEVKMEAGPVAARVPSRATVPVESPSRGAAAVLPDFARRRRPETATRYTSSEDEDAMPPGTVPLFAPDTSDEEDGAAAASTQGRGPTARDASTASGTTRPARHQLDEYGAVSHGVAHHVAHHDVSWHSVECGGAGPPRQDKAKGREIPIPPTPITLPLASGSKARAAAVSKTDPFYVSATGAIHHSSERAFAEVGSGPVQVVIGWEAATKYAVTMRRGMATSQELAEEPLEGGRDAMDIDV